MQNIADQLEKRSKKLTANRISIGSLALKSKSFQFSDRRLKFVSSNPIPKNLIKMSEEVKTDAAPAEAPTAEDLKGQKRSLEVRISLLPSFSSFFSNQVLSEFYISHLKADILKRKSKSIMAKVNQS